ncbi:MAG: 50S ribosomal protein L6 [Parcubacteria group bacterium]|jgi:large subunit ribosomal protein L6|nr:50S ribosomal protein L6 [Parcubacteria group bacterium]
MSRIGKQPIIIPEKVEVKIDQDNIIVKGPRGELKQVIPFQIEVSLKDKELIVKPRPGSKGVSAFWGLSRALIFNMVKGVTDGFEKKLEIEGVGYRVALQDNKLVLNLGFSHPIEIEAPAGIEFNVEKNLITVAGPDKQLVGQVAAKIRDQRKPEPYKGKGIHYLGEVIRKKAGKKAVGTE